MQFLYTVVFLWSKNYQNLKHTGGEKNNKTEKESETISGDFPYTGCIVKRQNGITLFFLANTPQL